MKSKYSNTNSQAFMLEAKGYCMMTWHLMYDTPMQEAPRRVKYSSLWRPSLKEAHRGECEFMKWRPLSGSCLVVHRLSGLSSFIEVAAWYSSAFWTGWTFPLGGQTRWVL